MEERNLAVTQPQTLERAGLPMLREQDVVDISPEEVPHLLDYWRIIVKRRWALLSCLLIVFSVVAIGTLKQKSVYQGKVLVEVNPEEPNVLNFKEVLRLDAMDVDSYRETQYKVLQSRTLAERVINDLQLFRNPEFYRRQALFGLITTNPSKIPSSSDDGPPDTSADAYRNSVKRFLDSASVSPVRRSNLVEVSFDSHNPNLAALIANRLAADYIDQNLQVKWDETLKASEWLSGRLVELKAKLEKSEDALQAYAQANSIVFIDDKKNAETSRLDQLQTELTKAQADRYEKESVYSLLQAGRIDDVPGILSNKLIQDLEFRLAESERDYAQLTAVVKPDYPKALQLKRQVDTLREALDRYKKALTQNIVDDYRAALAREKYLGDAVRSQVKVVNQIAERSITYNILKREVDTNKQLYEGLLQRLKEAQVSAGLKASNIRIVDPAEVPKGRVRPRITLNLTLGVIFGLGLGIALTLLQERLDNTVKTTDEVEQRLRLPALGVLPKFTLDGADRGEAQSLATTTEGVGPAAPAILTSPAALEAFRSLRTSILLSAPPVPKSILITSALPGEGKTTVTVNLGVTLASLGSKVVIVDCDMRRPSCHRSTGVENRPGFVQSLTGRIEILSCIMPVPNVENLSVIPCGPIPPNPAEILSSPMAAALLRQLRDQFDYVLVDSPPLLSVADSRILATLTDAVALVVRAYCTPYEAVRRARALMQATGARILGIALNHVDVWRDSYGGGYYYRYGYGYGYGYGRSQDGKSLSGESLDRKV